MTLTEKIKTLNLPKGEYVVVGGGVLEILGLRQAGDIDLAVTPAIHQKLRETGEWDEEIIHDKIFLKKDDFEINLDVTWPDFQVPLQEIIDQAMIIDDIRFMNLKHLRQFKQALGREKDLKDLALLDEYEKV